MAEQAFRDSLRQFNSRNTPEQSESLLGSFQQRASDAYNSFLGPNPDAECCGLTRFQRYLGFFMCLGASGLCFIMSLFFLPMVILAPGKFALTYTMGSVLFMTSFAVMNGYRAHFKALFGQDRFAFTIVYFMSMILTLYFTVIKPLYFMIILCTVVQFVALAWYLASYLPGGTQSLRWMTRNTIGLPV